MNGFKEVKPSVGIIEKIVKIYSLYMEYQDE